MFRILFVILVCLLVDVPRTSIQDGSVAPATSSTENTHAIEHFIRWLTEQQHRYQVASYALQLKNVFPRFAKFFHERSEEKYRQVKGLVQVCQVLNLPLNFQYIPSNVVNRPLSLLGPDRINQTNFVQFLLDLKAAECDHAWKEVFHVYREAFEKIVPLQMYLKKKFFFQQTLTCKITSDLYAQIDRLLVKSPVTSYDRSIPFSLMFVDSQATILREK